jgi:hypothetical protein
LIKLITTLAKIQLSRLRNVIKSEESEVIPKLI